MDDRLKEIDMDDTGIPEKYPRLKRFLLLVFSVFVIMLMISYVFATYPVANIIVGLFESSLLEDNRIELEDFSIQFEDGIAEMLKETYLLEQKVEFSVCHVTSANLDYPAVASRAQYAGQRSPLRPSRWSKIHAVPVCRSSW